MKLTLGIDSSTQGVKAVAWDVDAQKVVFSASVNYGKDLPRYGSPDGFLPNDDVLVRHADPRMWVEGLELVLKRLQESGCPMGDVAAIGGDAQQHATVYLSEHGVAGLRGWRGLVFKKDLAHLDGLVDGRGMRGVGREVRYTAANGHRFACN